MIPIFNGFLCFFSFQPSVCQSETICCCFGKTWNPWLWSFCYRKLSTKNHLHFKDEGSTRVRLWRLNTIACMAVPSTNYPAKSEICTAHSLSCTILKICKLVYWYKTPQKILIMMISAFVPHPKRKGEVWKIKFANYNSFLSTFI